MDKTVLGLIEKSLQQLQTIASEKEGDNNKNQESKLIFPKYREDEQKRISEQEARFLFIREIENQKNSNFYYSIETPTEKTYKFSDKNDEKYKPQIVEVEKGGQSASVDVTLYEKDNNEFVRKHLIEFKYGNVNTCEKDFLKLLCDDKNCTPNYYVNIINNCNKKTIKRLKDKYKGSLNPKHPKKSDLFIIVCILGKISNSAKKEYIDEKIEDNNRIIKYKINWNNMDNPFELF